jgi:hypothetical protein
MFTRTQTFFFLPAIHIFLFVCVGVCELSEAKKKGFFYQLAYKRRLFVTLSRFVADVDADNVLCLLRDFDLEK